MTQAEQDELNELTKDLVSSFWQFNSYNRDDVGQFIHSGRRSRVQRIRELLGVDLVGDMVCPTRLGVPKS